MLQVGVDGTAGNMTALSITVTVLLVLMLPFGEEFLPSCGDGKLTCYSGECITDEYECDGYADCTDGSDEVHCSSTSVCDPLVHIAHSLSIYLLDSEMVYCSMLDACTNVECNSSGNILEVKLLECNSPPALWVNVKNDNESPYDFVISEDTELPDPTGKTDVINFYVIHQSQALLLQATAYFSADLKYILFHWTTVAVECRLPFCPLLCDEFECVDSENDCDKSMVCGNYTVDDIPCRYLSPCEDLPGVFRNLAVYLMGNELGSCSVLGSCTGVRCSSSSSSLLVEFVQCNSNSGVQVVFNNHGVLIYDLIITGSTQLNDNTGKADILNFTIAHHSSQSSTFVLQVVAVTSTGERHILVPYTKTAIDCTITTCGALQDVVDRLNGLEQYTHCGKDRDCCGVECVGNTSVRLTILPCYGPPTIELEIKGGNYYLDHIFTKSQTTLIAWIHDEVHQIRVYLENTNDTIGFEVYDFTFASHSLAIEYTQVPIDTTQCEAPSASFLACARIMEDVGEFGYYTCSHNSACHWIDCVSSMGEHFKLTFLPCSVPQAVNITITSVPFDHTSSKSEEIELSAVSSFFVTLDHIKNDLVGFQLDVWIHTEEFNVTNNVISYVVVPLDTTICMATQSYQVIPTQVESDESTASLNIPHSPTHLPTSSPATSSSIPSSFQTLVPEERESALGMTVGLAVGVPAALVCCGVVDMCVLMIFFRCMRKIRKTHTIIQLQDKHSLCENDD